ncbi:MAG: hypothetical protein ACYC9L_06635 [Sulfuricaulis sp.]
MQKESIPQTAAEPANGQDTAAGNPPTIPGAASIGAELADELDVLYQRCLDLLQTQIEQADAIESELHELVGVEGHAPLLDINPERAIHPQAIYRVLAERLIQHMRPILDPRGARAATRFDDICVWLDEPLRLGLPLSEYLLRKVRFARGKSLRDLHQHILLRLTPESMPEDAAANACQELIRTLCVEVPPAIVIPVKETPPATVLYMVLARKPGDLSFHLSAYQIDRITQTLLAFATLAALDGNHPAATAINEASNNLRVRLQRAKSQYEDKESLAAGRWLTIKLRKDTIEFHVEPAIMALFRDQANGNMSRLEFISQ